VDLPNAPFYRRWSFILAGVIGLAAITALLGWRGLAAVVVVIRDCGIARDID